MNLNIEPKNRRAVIAKLKFGTKAFVDGKFVPSASGKTYASINPANGQTIAQIASCEPEDVNRAVQIGRQTFGSGVWSRMKPADRKTVMLKFVELLEKNALEISLLDSIDAGKPIFDCTTIDIPDAIHCIRWHAELADNLYERTSPSGPGATSLLTPTSNTRS